MSALLQDPRAYALLLTATLTVMSNATISPALPGLEAMFRLNPNAAILTRLLVTAPSLAVAILAPFAGLATDRLGVRKLLLLGVLVFGLAGTAGYWLDSLEAILLSRLLLGVAIACTMTSLTTLVGHYFAGEERARFMGYQLAATNFSGFLFVAVAGWIAAASARLPFMIYGLAILYLPLLWALIKEPQDSTSHGAPANTTYPNSSWCVRLAGLAVLAAITFTLFYIIPTQLPFALATRGFANPAVAGLALGAVTLSAGILALVFGPLRKRLGTAGVSAIGYLIMASGFAVLAGATSELFIYVSSSTIGAGVGLVMPNFMTTALGLVPASRRGTAAGIMTASIFLGQFLSPIITYPVIVAADYPGLFVAAAIALSALSLVPLSGLFRS